MFYSKRSCLFKFSMAVAMFLTASISHAQKVATGSEELWGGIIYAKSWANDYRQGRSVPFGYYSFHASANQFNFFPLYTDDADLQPDGGAVLIGDTLHLIHDVYGYGSHTTLYSAYDVRTWSLLRQESFYDFDLSAFDLALDPTTGKVYGEFSSSNSNNAVFGTIDFTSLKRTQIALMDTTFVGLACSPTGQLYGVNVDGNLYAIDKNNGSYQLVGSTGIIPSHYRQSAIIDPQTGTMYFSAQTADEHSGLYQIDTQTGHATLITAYDDNQEVCGLVFPNRRAAGKSPAQAANVDFSFPEGSLSGDVTFTAPQVAHDSTPLGDTRLNILAVANGDTIARGTALAGQQAALKVQVPAAGKYRFELIAANAYGNGESYRQNMQWIGYDEPRIDTVTLAIDSASRKAEVSWSTPRVGIHGGYISPSKLKFNVLRLPDSVRVASAITDSSLTETLPQTERQLWQYAVQPVNDTVKGAVAISSEKALGDSVSLPYHENFNTRASVTEMCNRYDANHDGVQWSWAKGRAVYNAGGNYGDDYLLTPAMHLKANQLYQLSFTVHGGQGHRMQVKLGSGTNSTNREKYHVVMKTTEFASSVDTTVYKELQVNADGLYRIAFRAASDAMKQDLQLDNIKIQQGMSQLCPDKVSNLQATAGAKAALSATIRFTAPVKALNGTALTQLKAVNIYRNHHHIATLNDVHPGKSCSYNDLSALQGWNTYEVAAENSAGEGLQDSVRVYTGSDRPFAVQHLRLADNFNGTATLSWVAPDTLGHNGGYVDSTQLNYFIYQDDYTNIAPIDTVSHTSYGTAYTTYGTQSCYWYTVGAGNSVGNSELQASNMLIAGTAYTLPFKESFPNGNYSTLWWVDNDVETKGFRVEQNTSADDDLGCICWYPTNDEKFGAIYSGKIDISKAQRPTLSFWYYEIPGFDGQMSLQVDRDLRESSEVWQTNMSALTGKTGWKRVSIDLTRFKDSHYIVLKFFAKSNTIDGHALFLDDIEVNDVLDHNVGIELQAPAAVTEGLPTQLLAQVSNKGLNPESVELTLAEDEQGKAVSVAKFLLNAQTDTTLVWAYTPTAKLRDTRLLTVTASIADDEDLANNSSSATVTVNASNLPTVSSLKAEGGNIDDTNVKLIWTAPAASGEHWVTDGFEDYTPWTINAIGMWSVTDSDRQSSYSFQQQFKHSGSAYAFIVTNPASIGADYTQANQQWVAPHSGLQYLTAFSAIGAQSNDWLTSPLLSGKQQTVHFYAKALSSDYTEPFEVWADGKLIAQQTATATWTDYAYELPTGTQHFSIRYRGNDSFGLMIDDVTYSDGDYTVTGYQVYRDGVLVGTTNANTLTWTDTLTHDGSMHAYAVAACYKMGTSALSESQNVVTGINNIQSQDNKKSGRFYNTNGQRTHRDAHGVIIVKQQDGSVQKVLHR